MSLNNYVFNKTRWTSMKVRGFLLGLGGLGVAMFQSITDNY
jgi:hypothetical protein